MHAFIAQPLVQLIVFCLGTTLLLWWSRKPLQQKHSHGYYRFFAWLCMWIVIVLNLPVWETDPFSLHQLCSAALLVASIVLVVQGVQGLKRLGQPDAARQEEGLYGFERTTQLVTDGVFRYIRHPMYASLIFLAWGACMQRPNISGAVLASTATYLLWLTAKADERECTAFFGQAYRDYMGRSKRFIPFVF